MKKKVIVCLIIGIMMAFTLSVAQEQNKGAKEMELSGGSKGKVPFPHQKHQETMGDCKVCHDVFPQEAGSIEKSKADGKLKSKEVMNKLCIKCHKDKAKAGEKTGPTSCSKCHQK